MTDPPPNSPHPIPQSQPPIDFDVACIRCEYNLRGLLRTGRCPECGRLIELSLGGRFLRYADARWLRSVLRGVCLRIALLAPCVLFFSGLGIQWGRRFGLSVLLTALSAMATFMITKEERNSSHRSDGATGRRGAKILSVAAIVAAIVEQGWSFGTDGAIVMFVGLAIILELVHLRDLAERIPNDRLATNTGGIAWGLGVCGVGCLLGFLSFLPSSKYYLGDGISGVIALLGCFSLLGFVCCIAALFGVLVTLAIELREELQSATSADFDTPRCTDTDEATGL